MFHSLRWLPITHFCKDLAPNSFRMTWQTFRAIRRMESLKVSLQFRPLRFVRISPSKLPSLLYPEKQQPQPQKRNQNKQQQATTTTTITTTTTTTGHKTITTTVTLPRCLEAWCEATGWTLKSMPGRGFLESPSTGQCPNEGWLIQVGF